MLSNHGFIGKYERFAVIPIPQVLPYIRYRECGGPRPEAVFCDVPVYVDSTRLHLFKKVFNEQGYIKCVRCGLKAAFFAAERAIDQHEFKGCDKPRCHLNLYGVDYGHHILFTIDHILPRSKGGETRVNNLQPMCLNCNGRKGQLPEEVDRLLPPKMTFDQMRENLKGNPKAIDCCLSMLSDQAIAKVYVAFMNGFVHNSIKKPILRSYKKYRKRKD